MSQRRRASTVLKYLLIGATAVAGAACLPPELRASEWGCQVLLCLSGDWQGTPSCHPPVYRLIAAMKAPGFSWPTCPQANSSAARYDKYEDCPSGWQATGRTDSDRPGMRGEPNVCQIRADKLTLPAIHTSGRFGHGNDAGSRQVQVEVDGKLVPAEVQTISNGRRSFPGDSSTFYAIPRALREKPWYIEYDDANGIRQKSWFNLNMR
ncbi:MAG: hypothetical protein EOR23_25455 [Mesorhizobium sp.]|nr:MAG: hypothetical protein EOR23_25455 [Mesorhizobium sp.]TIP95585.1 MAG: hypothetical protein E5X58_02045 [Mesorhizobium sp.]